MSDVPKAKPGSLRDRIAAFEKSNASAPSPAAPPPPRPKPGNLAWKPKSPSPPESPSSPAESEKKAGMSANDARHSIGMGGSLKERMAALQGKGGFGPPGGGAPAAPPKPAADKPKWKPPPAPIASPEEKEGDEATKEGEGEAMSPPAEGATDTAPAEGEAPAQEGEEGEPDSEEEERQRRAALAARMARLGGARIGMAPPVYGKKPEPKKPEMPKEEEAPKDEKIEENAKPAEHAEQEPKADTPSLKSPTETPASKKSEGEDYFKEHKESSSVDSNLLTPNSGSGTSSRSPTSVPIPAVPRRAGPPRRKAAKSPSPAPQVLDQDKLKESPAPLTDVEPLEAASQKDDAVPAASANEVLGDRQEEIGQVSESVERDLPPVVTKVEEGELSAGATPELDALATTGDLTALGTAHADTQSENLPATVDVPIPAPSDPVTSGEASAVEEPAPKSPIATQEVEETTQELSPSSLPDPAPEPGQAAFKEAEPEPAQEEEEEDEAARRKRVAERLAKMGGINPFAAPPRPPSISSPSTSPAEAGVRSPVSDNRSSLRKGSTDSAIVSSAAEPGRRTSLKRDSVGSGAVASPSSRKSSIDVIASQAEPSDVHAVESATTDPVLGKHVGSIDGSKEEENTDDRALAESEETRDISEEPESQREHETGDDQDAVSLDAEESKLVPEQQDIDPLAEEDEAVVPGVASQESQEEPSPPASRPSSIDVQARRPESISARESQSPVLPRRSIPPPPRAIPTAPEDTSDEPEDTQSTSPGHSLPPPPLSAEGVPPPPSASHPSPAVVDLRTGQIHDDPTQEHESLVSPVSSPRRSIPPPPRTLPPMPSTQTEEPEHAPAPHRSVPPPPPVLSEESEVVEAEPEAIVLDENIQDGSADVVPDEFRSVEEMEEPPLPPARRSSVPVPRLPLDTTPSPPPPVPVATRPTRGPSVHSGGRAETATRQPPAPLDLQDERQEIMDDSDGDPIDPQFHSPIRSPGSQSTFAHPSPSAVAVLSPPTSAAPAPAMTEIVPEMEEDPEQAHRRTIAERMAKLGGIRFGAPPPIPKPQRPPPPPEETTEAQQEVGADAAEPSRTEEPQQEEGEEEDEQARRARIAARLANMGGMRFGMLPGAPPPPPSQTRPARRATQDEEDAPPPPPAAPHRAVPPARPPPPTTEVSQESETDDGEKVEAESSEAEEVSYEEAQEEPQEEAPPPVPSRESRRPSVPVMSPPPVPRGIVSPPPSGRPPIPAVPANFADRRSSAASRKTSGATVTPSQSDYVMVEEPGDNVPPPPPRPAHRPPPGRIIPTAPTVPPPAPPAPAAVPESSDSQWELPSIPSGGLDFGASSDLSASGFSEDSTNYPTSESPPPRPPAKSVPPGPEPEVEVPAAASKAPSQPPAELQLSADELMIVWGKVGVQVCEVATTLFDKSKKALVGDGSYTGFVDEVLGQVPNAAHYGPPAYGYMVYSQTGSSVQRRASDIMPGDIFVATEARLKGHMGLKGYTQNVGLDGEALVGVVSEYETKKTKVRVFQANQHVGQQTVEEISYRLDDLKSGSVKIFRILEAP